MFLFSVIAFLVFLLAFVHYKQKRRRDAVANFKGPFCIPGIGPVHFMFTLDTKTFLQRGLTFREIFGKVSKVWAFNRLIIFSGDSELNEQILSSQQHIKKQQNYLLLEPWLGTGLLMSDGRKWHSRRRIITPTFHFKILEEFVEVFDQQSDILVQRLANEAESQRCFDVFPYVCLAALDVIAETAMGTKVYAQSDTSSSYAKGVNELTKIMAWRFMRIFFHNNFIFSLFRPGIKARQDHLIKELHSFTIDVIEKRRAALAESLKENTTDQAYESFYSKKKMALLDVLLQSTIDGQPLSNEAIREEVDTFMFEGHDTSTSAMAFALHYLARHPQVQQKLYEEVVETIGSVEAPLRPVTMKQLSEMKYLECVIKETLRLSPSVPLIGRQIVDDFKYTHSKYGDGFIAAGTEFFVSIFSMNYDPDYFEEPFAFKPERHFQKETNDAFRYVPFSAGPRNCVGQKFAMLEMKMMLAKVVRAYELLPLGPAVELELNIVLRSSTGFHLGLKKRK